MISKGTHIPEQRLLLAVEAANRAALAFEEWAGVGVGELPANEIDAMQVQVMRWQQDRFGHVPHGDAVIALGVIEELGETFDDDASAEDAVDGLGDVMVYGANLCTSNRLALRHVIELACRYTSMDLPSPIAIAGRFAHVVGKHEQRTRGLGEPGPWRLCLVDALAMMIAKALEDCSLGHELTIDPGGVFVVIGNEVIARKAGDTMIPAPAINVTRIEVNGDDPDRFAHGLVETFKGIDRTALAGFTIRNPPTQAETMAKLHGGIDALAAAEQIEGSGSFDISDVLNHEGICPQCAAPMSYDGSKPVYTCSNGHSLTAKQLRTLQLAAPYLDGLRSMNDAGISEPAGVDSSADRPAARPADAVRSPPRRRAAR